LHGGGWVPKIHISIAARQSYFHSHQQVDQSPAHSTLDNGLDLIVCTVGQVADGPACIDEHLVVQGVNQFGQDSERGSDLD